MIERHFTYADIQDFCLEVFYPIHESETVSVLGVKLVALEDCSRPLWFAQCRRQQAMFPPLHFSCLVTERVGIDGTTRLAFLQEESLPFGLRTPAEEDAEIERARRQAREVRIAAESTEPCSEEVMKV